MDLELGREVRQWSPWKDGDELPEDKERFVEFEFVCGFLVDFSRLEIISNFLYLKTSKKFLKLFNAFWPSLPTHDFFKEGDDKLFNDPWKVT